MPQVKKSRHVDDEFQRSFAMLHVQPVTQIKNLEQAPRSSMEFMEVEQVQVVRRRFIHIKRQAREQGRARLNRTKAKIEVE